MFDFHRIFASSYNYHETKINMYEVLVQFVYEYNIATNTFDVIFSGSYLPVR